MKRTLFVATLVLISTTTLVALAQPPGGRGPSDRGDRPGPTREGDRVGPPRDRNREGGREGGREMRLGDRPNGPAARREWGGRGPRGPGGPGGPPNPEQFVEHAMQFDADKDGKLSKDELLKFAAEIAQRRQSGDRPREGRADDRQPSRSRRPAAE